ncbi:MAG: DNA polymerase III subunit epsilon [Pseudomonadota bacterium]
MREIIFDTETTGLDNRSDRIIEIGAVELENRFPTGRNFHVFINPQGKKVHPDALNVHGITDESLLDKPVFAEIIDDWIKFTAGAKLIAHNAKFDVGFFNAEFERLGFPPIDDDSVIDSLSLARRRHPMGPNSLDALCKRYGIDNSKREKHGALLDSELLAEVYIELIGGKQAALTLESAQDAGADSAADDVMNHAVRARSTKLPSPLGKADREAHKAMIAKIGEKSLWLQR